LLARAAIVTSAYILEFHEATTTACDLHSSSSSSSPYSSYTCSVRSVFLQSRRHDEKLPVQELMSISVYIGHNGRCLVLDPSVTSSLDAVRSWIASQTNISPRSQILLTAQGKQVRNQTLLTENELFVFDSGWLNGKNAPTGTKDALGSEEFEEFSPGAAPDIINNQNDLQSWQNLFRSRKSWAADLLEGCLSRAKLAEQFRAEQSIIERSLGVAVASLQQHIKTGEKQYAQSAVWSSELLQEQQAHTDKWEQNLGSLRSIPARAEFARFIPPMAPISGSRRNSQQYIATLQGFVDVVTVKQAAGAARSLVNELANRIDRIRDDLNSATEDSNELLRAVDQINDRSLDDSTSEPAQLVKEIELVVKKMASDLEHVQSLPKTPAALSQASKMALLHTRNYVPNLSDYCNEMNELVHRRRDQREGAVNTTWEHMRTLSAIESRLAKLYQDIKELDMPADQQQPFMTLGIVSRLPSVYGQLLVESIRRREWVAKMKRDCGTLQEEVAAYQDEEDKRRKKWIRNVEDVVSPVAFQTRPLGIELSLKNEGGSWPMVTREELAEYLKTLLEVYGPGPVTEELEQAIADLDKPTRRQVKHAKAFKNGSMHEAAFGDTSLMLRGDEQSKTMREANVRLEEDLKAQKSRVRKLEDLLHRQSQISRASTGDIFTPGSEDAFSQRMATPPVSMTHQYSGETSRPGSLSQRRGSMAQAPGYEERRLAKRIVDLEAELQTLKDAAVSRKSSDAETQKQVEDALSTKRDLMENMEAQQREFATERLNLEKELREARDKIEEAENEIERLVGSREGVDEEVIRLKEDAAGHAARAATEHDARSSIEKKYELAEAARSHAEDELQKLRGVHEQKREMEAEQLQSLTVAHNTLAPHDAVPDDLVALAAAVEDLTRKSAAHAKDLEEAVAFAKSENESLSSSNERQKNELVALGQEQSETEDHVRQAEEKLAAADAKVKSLEEQLVLEQEQLRMLRSKFADGETGSEVLRQRVSDEEERAGKLSSELAEAQSHINSLDIELTRLQKKHKEYAATADTSSERLVKRAERAKEVSQKLYLQNLRLGRLLERLGLVYTYQNESMVVERASKMAVSTTITDPHSHMSRTVSVQSPPPTRKSSSADNEAPTDLKLLHWADALTLEDETSQYEAFLSHLSRFDLDVFSDAVTKRVKDFEYTAKKYSKESKESTKRADAYKERAVKLRTEAHSKIAVRDFKEGDMALFLPTRGGQVKGAWAAFNIGCPHYFLAERDGMRLGTRDFIVARIQKVEQKIVDLSGQRTATGTHLPADGRSIETQASEGPSSLQVEDDNPFDLSDGLTWWMVHAVEERGAGAAPTTPGLGKSTVSTATVDAKGSIRIKPRSKGDDASKHLNKSLDSRRSSTTSKKGAGGGGVSALASPTGLHTPNNLDGTTRSRSESQTSNLNQALPLPSASRAMSPPPRPLPAPSGSSGLGISDPITSSAYAPSGNNPQAYEQVRNDLLWGP
jgi:autophagy-related protein 11